MTPSASLKLAVQAAEDPSADADFGADVETFMDTYNNQDSSDEGTSDEDDDSDSDSDSDVDDEDHFGIWDLNNGDDKHSRANKAEIDSLDYTEIVLPEMEEADLAESQNVLTKVRTLYPQL